jgi:8-oxo-dGTP diphosphatase
VLRDDNPNIPFPNCWNTPGGGIDEGEHHDAAVRRELREEICVEPSTVLYKGTTTYADGSVVHRYVVLLTDDERAAVRLGDEGQRLDWFSYDEVLALNASPRFVAYFSTHERDIRRALEGGVEFEATHELL